MKSSISTCLLVGIGLVVLLVGCAKAPSEQGTADPTATSELPLEPTTPPTETEPAEPGYDVIFEQVECRFSDFFDAGLSLQYETECGYLIVPEDRSQPDGPTVRLPFAVIKSTSPEPASDPVIHLIGGPGGDLLSSAGFYLDAGGERFLENRDYILFNQRGTNFTEPALDCPDYGVYLFQLSEQDISQEEYEALSTGRLLECHDDFWQQGIDLSMYNSAASAADVNDLVHILGYEQVNLYGISYGSRLALTIMRDYPSIIRSAIIDSVYPPQVSLEIGVPTSAYRSFKVLFDDCAADQACNESYPDLELVFHQQVTDLNANPVTIEIWGPNDPDAGGPEHIRYYPVVDGELFIEAIFSALYDTEALPELPGAIYRFAQGNHEAIAPCVQNALWAPVAVSYGMYHAVQCHEEVPFESMDDAFAAADELPAPLDESRFLTGAGIFEVCAGWDAGPVDPIENQPVVSDIPTLVLSGQYDPVTPPEWGQLAAETLSNSYFYEFEGIGHGVMRSSYCAFEMGLAFLNDPTSEPDSSCMVDLIPPDFIIQ